jgi:alkaline phosphatase D
VGQIPYWPYVPLRFGKNRLRMKGVEYLAEGIKAKGIDFLLFLGDAIYADVPYFSGVKLETYLRKYRQVHASDSYRKVYEQIPVMHMFVSLCSRDRPLTSRHSYDDHEVKNDYDGGSETNTFKVANKAFQLYHGSANPTVQVLEADPVNYHWFRHGDSAFFVLDTRRYRSPNDAPDVYGKTMLGDVQKQVFKDWLRTVNETVTWKFVVSSVPFMTLWDSGIASAKDTFAAFTTERAELLDLMEYVPKCALEPAIGSGLMSRSVIVLSGDRHEFAAASMRGKVLEFSTSPLHQVRSSSYLSVAFRRWLFEQFYLPIRTLSQSHGLGATGEDVLLKCETPRLRLAES